MACLLAGLAHALGRPAPARAWTNTQPSSAVAHVDVWPTGRALVQLVLELDVRGGWLSELEVSGLDPGSVLDPDKPPWLVCADGRKAAPRAVLHPDGTLALTFTRGDAPRRGRHRLGITYFTQLARTDLASGARRLAFALPAWRAELEHVDLWVNAPAPARFLDREESALDSSASRELLERGGRVMLHLHRAALPRTLAFGVELELPARAAPRAESTVAERGPHELQPWWLALAVLPLAWLKRRSVRAHAAQSGGWRPRDLVRLAPAARGCSMTALALGGALAYPRSPALGLALLAGCVALALHRHVGTGSAKPPGRFDLAHAQALLGGPAWLDATTPLGLALLGSGYALFAARVALGIAPSASLELLLLVTPLWLTGTRLHRVRARHVAVPPAQPEPVAAPDPGPEPALSPRAVADRRAPDRAA